MFFNSLDFALFLPIIFFLYWFALGKNFKAQNLLIVIASYFFYGWWDWRFLGLIFFSSVVDFFVGIQLEKQTNKRLRKFLLILSLSANLGLLGFFKYYNFFVDNFVDAFTLFGTRLNASSLNIILPVGISFYTFQTLSYSIDVYRKQLKSTTNFVSFSAFVSFFPQLVAGPIERATNLLPQFLEKRTFDYHQAVDGLRQILWGLFKKIVIADTCATYANIIFEDTSGYSGSTLLVGALFFTFQIYGDFSGYSDIAIGTSRLFGFRLKRNFAFPYFSRDISEFWRRWHISLSTWFRDYLYIPLGGSRGSTFNKIRNTFIIFLVSGFWHGANWTFIAWGFLNALLFIPLLLTNKNRKHLGVIAEGKTLPDIRSFLNMFLTFWLTVLIWVFFRAETIQDALEYIAGIFSKSLFTLPEVRPTRLFILLALFLLIEWNGRANKYAIEKLGISWNRIPRYIMYYGMTFLIYYFSYESTKQQFIYFQF